MRLFYSTCFLCFLAILGNAQEVYNGRIINAITLSPVPDATVQSISGGDIFTTNNAGFFQAIRATATTDSIIVSAPGYFTKTFFVPGDVHEMGSLGLYPSRVGLQTLEVNAFEGERTIQNAPYAAQTINPEALTGFDQASVQDAVNLVPGVKMDSRGPGGSRRISIRGSLLREPYGVRNIKLYWNEIPLTSPDGSTPLELWDPEETGEAEIIKGPNGSLYGGGNGGVILLNSKKPEFGKRRFEFSAIAGKYGYFRSVQKAAVSNPRFSFSLLHILQRYDGYRNQESNRKGQFFAQANFIPNNKRFFTFHILYYNGSWELPGGLTAQEAENNPRQALPFSENHAARVERKWIGIGITQRYYFAEKWQNTTSAFINSTVKLNPYGTSTANQGFKDEGANNYSVRTRFTHKNHLLNKDLEVNLGVEGQFEEAAIDEFNNAEGREGNLKYSADYSTGRVLTFGQAQWQLLNKTRVHIGVGFNFIHYNYVDIDTILPDYSGQRQWQVITGRIALVQNLTENATAFVSVGNGFSSPTVWELQGNQGAFNRSLQPETALNAEAGFRTSFSNEKFHLLLNGYYTIVDDVIIPFTLISGEAVFENLGGAVLTGAEFNASSRIPIGSLLFTGEVSASYQHYYFSTYSEESTKGNNLPGVTPFSLNILAETAFKNGLSLRVYISNNSAMPLNNANEEKSPAYTVVNASATYGLNLSSKWILEGRIGCNNITNTQYTSFFQLNAFGNRFYNPMPEISPFGGLKLVYIFEREPHYRP